MRNMIKEALAATLSTTNTNVSGLVFDLEFLKNKIQDTPLTAVSMVAGSSTIFLGAFSQEQLDEGSHESAATVRLEELEAYANAQKTEWFIDLIIRAAEAAHEANRVYCESIGDHSQVRWGGAPDWQQESAVKSVLFKLENPAAEAEDMHESWCAVKEADGWVHGDKKCADKKTHPCLVAYADLSAEQQAKDSLFSAVVAPFLPARSEY